jgi:hypothetical protein
VKPPTRPPVFQELLKQLSPSRFLEILSQSSGWMKADRYLHWHDFRRRPAPAGFTVEEWLNLAAVVYFVLYPSTTRLGSRFVSPSLIH